MTTKQCDYVDVANNLACVLVKGHYGKHHSSETIFRHNEGMYVPPREWFIPWPSSLGNSPVFNNIGGVAMSDESMHRDGQGNLPPAKPREYPLSGPVPHSYKPCVYPEHPERAHHHASDSADYFVHRHPGCPDDCPQLAYKREAQDSEPPAQTAMIGYGENTLQKVATALRRAGLDDDEDVTDAILQMQNEGILFRERELTPDVDAVMDLCNAIRLTVEYTGTGLLPPIPGWSWYDALVKYAPDMAAKLAAQPRPTTKAGPDVLTVKEDGVTIVYNGETYLRVLEHSGLPAGLTISRDERLLNWRGDNYVRQTPAMVSEEESEQAKYPEEDHVVLDHLIAYENGIKLHGADALAAYERMKARNDSIEEPAPQTLNDLFTELLTLRLREALHAPGAMDAAIDIAKQLRTLTDAAAMADMQGIGARLVPQPKEAP